MYGENVRGRKVNLLNDGPPPPRLPLPPASTSNPAAAAIQPQSHSASFARPDLPQRCRPSYPASLSSTSSSQTPKSNSKDNSTQSSRSSISCSPRHSPPTPPLARLDSNNSSSSHSLNTPPPMDHSYDYDALDPQGTHNKNQASRLPYYSNGFRQQQLNGGDDGTSYAPMQAGDQQLLPLNQYNGMHAQQPLPPMYPMTAPAFPQQQQASIPRYEAPTSLPQYQTNPLRNHLAQPPPPQLQLQPLPQSHHHVNIHPLIPALPALQANLPPLSISTIDHDLASADTTTPSTPITATSATSPIRPTSNAPSASTSTPNSAGVFPPKKKYPCPHAKEYKCSDNFTTSGHAARHGKKHTGEKNVRCPTCNKAFTRKDNMKQHERTHRAGHLSNRGPTLTVVNSHDGTEPSSTTSSPTTAGGSKDFNSARKRTMSSSTMSSAAASFPATEGYSEDDEDEDADGDVDMEIPPLPTPTALPAKLGSMHRPPVGTTHRQDSAAGRNITDQGDLDADGEVDDDEDEDEDEGDAGGGDGRDGRGGVSLLNAAVKMGRR